MQAEKELLAARKLAPDDPTILGPLIQTYRQAERYDDALKMVNEALKVLPNKSPIYLEQAQIFMIRRGRSAPPTRCSRHSPTTGARSIFAPSPRSS